MKLSFLTLVHIALTVCYLEHTFPQSIHPSKVVVPSGCKRQEGVEKCCTRCEDAENWEAEEDYPTYFLSLYLLRQGFTIYPMLALNSIFSQLSLPQAEITGTPPNPAFASPLKQHMSYLEYVVIFTVAPYNLSTFLITWACHYPPLVHLLTLPFLPLTLHLISSCSPCCIIKF
jgi:hypothetical protein